MYKIRDVTEAYKSEKLNSQTQNFYKMEKSFINYLLAKQEIAIERVIEAIQSFTKNDSDRMLQIMSYLTCFSDKPVVKENSQIRKNATLKSYDFFNDEVHYEYIESRFFKVSEDWIEHNGKFFASYYDIPSDIRESRGDIEIEVFWKSSNTCSLYNWNRK